MCQVEAGWMCTGSPSTCNTICGDNIIAGSEQCDDGNLVSGDGCSSTCQTECLPAGQPCLSGSQCCSLICMGSQCQP
jgi:cysteine-rich repeat protein